MATSAEAETEAAPHGSSAEDLCREAAQKLMKEFHATIASSSQCSAQHPHELTAPQCAEEESDEVESTTRAERGGSALTNDPPDIPHSCPSKGEQPPSYNEAVNCSESVQIPLQRGDGTVSFNVPPPPPPSPGDALYNTPKRTPSLRHVPVAERVSYPDAFVPQFPPALGLVYPYGTPNPMVVGGHPAYAVVAAPSPLLCMQAAHPVMQGGQLPPGPVTAVPSTIVNQNTTNAINQNVNNVNVVVENNIDLGKRYPSYICFSLALCFICCLLDPTALVCVVPALICSCVACCAGDYKLSRQTGRCALVWNVTALIYGITAFFLLVAPVIIIAAVLAAY